MRKNKSDILEFLFLCCVSITFFSCGGRPSNVLDEDEMVDLMVDMELAEAYVAQQSSPNPDYRVEIGQRVLAAHGVSEETLDTTLAWYGRNIDDYTSLFEKIDREIEIRRLKYTDQTVEKFDVNNLWSYSTHIVISPLSGSDVFTFSLDNPEIEKGEIVKFSFYMANPTNVKGSIGVDYSDGSGETLQTNFSGKNKLEMLFQSDTVKQIARLYGAMLFKDRNSFPLYIDSISISLHPIDSTEYRQKKRSQKVYGVLQPRRIEKKEENLDVDSISNVDSLKISEIEKAEDKTAGSLRPTLQPSSKSQSDGKSPSERLRKGEPTKRFLPSGPVAPEKDKGPIRDLEPVEKPVKVR